MALAVPAVEVEVFRQAVPAVGVSSSRADREELTAARLEAGRVSGRRVFEEGFRSGGEV